MVSTTGEHSAWFELDKDLKPQPAAMPAAVRHVVDRIAENCEPALCTVLFMAGAGGSLRAGVTENPVRLTRSVRDTLTKVTLGGVPAYVWPGGGITLMVDVARMPEKSFGYVPTPALVAPIEFTLRADDYAALGGYASRAVSLDDVLRAHKVRVDEKGADVSAIAARLSDGRLHLQHGPIDLIIEAFGAADEVERAYGQAIERFGDILPILVSELPLLRQPIGAAYPLLQGPVARRMVEAVWPHRAVYITPMAAVAGAVADEMLQALVQGRTLDKAYVNDGGDIALHLMPGHELRAGIFATALDGVARLTSDQPVRGIATSGRGGRSFSLGIADSATVLAATAAAADAAATLIANAVNVDHPSIERRPARELDPDSDLGDLPVTVAVGALPDDVIAEALDRGAAEARRLRLCSLIEGAALSLRGHWRFDAQSMP